MPLISTAGNYLSIYHMVARMGARYSLLVFLTKTTYRVISYEVVEFKSIDNSPCISLIFHSRSRSLHGFTFILLRWYKAPKQSEPNRGQDLSSWWWEVFLQSLINPRVALAPATKTTVLSLDLFLRLIKPYQTNVWKLSSIPVEYLKSSGKGF